MIMGVYDGRPKRKKRANPKKRVCDECKKPSIDLTRDWDHGVTIWKCNECYAKNWDGERGWKKEGKK
jgi:ribosomal protein L37AE/L43A